MCDISEFEENEKNCVYFVHNCLQFLQLYSFTYTTYKPSHHNHSIIPLSNHHTIIILKSIELRNIYVSKIVWFWYDYGMMVWKWYDCMTSVWCFVSCVCEWVQLKKLQTVVKEAHTLFLVFFKLQNITQSTSLSFRFLQLFHIRKWLDNILKTSEDQVIKPSVVIRFDVVYPRVSLKTLKSKSVLFYSFFYQ